MARMARRLTRPALLLLALGLAACAGEADTPEDRIRRVVDAMARAVEARDVAAVKEHVADDFEDFQGRDRRELAQLLTFHTMRNQSIHVLVRVREITFPRPGEAQAEVVAATAGRPIETGADLATLRADVYALDLDFVERDGIWQLIWAQWRPTPPTDLL